MYKVTDITDMSNMLFLLEILQIHYKPFIKWLIMMQRNGYIPPHVHMHLCRPHLSDSKGVGAPVAQDVFSHRAL